MTQPKVKYPYRSTVRWAFMQWADIEDAQNPSYVYLRRLRVVQSPFFAIYLHFIYVRDGDRAPHNHPMNFWSLILKGGYTEDRFLVGPDGLSLSVGTRTRRRFSLARTVMSDFHSITGLASSPTITMLFVGKRSQSWGFLTEGGYMDKLAYWAGPAS